MHVQLCDLWLPSGLTFLWVVNTTISFLSAERVGGKEKHNGWRSEWYLKTHPGTGFREFHLGIKKKIRSELRLHYLLRNNSGQFIQLLPGWSFSAANGRCLPCSLVAPKTGGRIEWAKYERVLWALNHLTKVWDDLFCSLKCQRPPKTKSQKPGKSCALTNGAEPEVSSLQRYKGTFPLSNPCWHMERKSANIQVIIPVHFSEEKLRGAVSRGHQNPAHWRSHQHRATYHWFRLWPSHHAPPTHLQMAHFTIPSPRFHHPQGLSKGGNVELGTIQIPRKHFLFVECF